LVEATPPGTLPAVFDERNLSFADATINALEALGVMSKLRPPTGAITRIHVSRRGDFGRARMVPADYGKSAERRVGEECVSPFIFQWSPYTSKKPETIIVK